LCVALIAIGRREGYLIGIYACLSYAVLAYSNGLFGEVYLNLYFFIPTNLLGYFLWHQHSQGKEAVAMRRLTSKTRLIILLACMLGTFGLGTVLAMNAEQNSPYIDALTNVLSVAATILMMWRFKEQWLLYIAINVVSILMWLLRAMDGGAAGDLMVLMWSLYLLNSLFGFWRWHIGEQQQQLILASRDNELANTKVVNPNKESVS
jgi:nicotinamide mononucleotide transporter